jgi:hypothetical protein
MDRFSKLVRRFVFERVDLDEDKSAGDPGYVGVRCGIYGLLTWTVYAKKFPILHDSLIEWIVKQKYVRYL